MLQGSQATQPSKRRLSAAERKATFEAVRESAQESLGEIDVILDRHGGRRISKSPTALGSIVVESNAAGLMALAASDLVKTILEDQPVSLIE